MRGQSPGGIITKKGDIMTHLAAVFRQAELDAVRYGMLSEFAFSRRGDARGGDHDRGCRWAFPVRWRWKSV